MIRRRVSIATVDESVCASLFTSSADRTYLDTTTVPPKWSVTLASTRRDGSSIKRPSDVCDASAPAVAPTQAAPRDRLKKDAKRPRQGDHQDTHQARPPPWDPSSAAVVVSRPGQWQPQLPAPWPLSAPLPAPGWARGADPAPFDGTVRRTLRLPRILPRTITPFAPLLRVAQSIAETHTLRHVTARIHRQIQAFLSFFPLEQSERPFQTGLWMACWACGALFALHTHCQPPQSPHCSTQGGLALLCPPPPPASYPEAQLCVQARAHLPPASWRPLLLFPTSLWHISVGYLARPSTCSATTMLH